MRKTLTLIAATLLATPLAAQEASTANVDPSENPDGEVEKFDITQVQESLGSAGFSGSNALDQAMVYQATYEGAQAIIVVLEGGAGSAEQADASAGSGAGDAGGSESDPAQSTSGEGEEAFREQMTQAGFLDPQRSIDGKVVRAETEDGRTLLVVFSEEVGPPASVEPQEE